MIDAEIEWDLNEWGGYEFEDTITYPNGVVHLITIYKGTMKIKVPSSMEDKVKSLRGYVNRSMIHGKNFAFLPKCVCVVTVETEECGEGDVECRLRIIEIKTRGNIWTGRTGPVTWNSLPNFDGTWSSYPVYMEQDYEDCLKWKP